VEVDGIIAPRVLVINAGIVLDLNTFYSILLFIDNRSEVCPNVDIVQIDYYWYLRNRTTLNSMICLLSASSRHKPYYVSPLCSHNLNDDFLSLIMLKIIVLQKIVFRISNEFVTYSM
jgi:hypothetical protein